MRKRTKVYLVRPTHRRFYLMRWTCPRTGEPREESTKESAKKRAQDAASKKEHELSTKQLADDKLSWPDFKQRFEDLYLVNLRPASAVQWQAACAALEAKCRPKLLVDVTSAMLHDLAAKRLADGIAPATIAKDARTLRVALRWAAEVMNLISACPRFRPPKKLKGRQTGMRSRPITEAEFRKMLAAIPKVRTKDAREWRRYLIGLWLSGLRAEESIALAWDEATGSGFSIDLTEDDARFRILAESQKADRDEFAPMAPAFETFLLKTPKKKRTGFAFFAGRYRPHYVRQVISKIGQRSGIVVDREKESFAASHTLRRSFGTRWARRVLPADLKALMRHRNIATTMTFYVGVDASEVNRSIRRAKPKRPVKKRSK